MKVCKGCGRTLLLINFFRDERARDGRQALCKQCHGGIGRAYRATENGRRRQSLSNLISRWDPPADTALKRMIREWLGLPCWVEIDLD